jgi:hypothetical protein
MQKLVVVKLIVTNVVSDVNFADQLRTDPEVSQLTRPSSGEKARMGKHCCTCHARV